MTTPIKKAGFAQGIYDISSSKKEAVGTVRRLHDGREFVYSKAGSSALSAGKLGMMADVASTVINKAAIAAAVGTTVLTGLTIGSATFAEDYFAGGYFIINDEIGEGQCYGIEASSAVATGTSINISLTDPIKVALTTSSEFSLIQHPNMAVIESADEENHPVGVAPVAVTAAYYYWAQTKGIANVLINGTVAVWDMIVPGAVAGSVKTLPDYSTATDPDMPIVGQAVMAGVDTEYRAVNLNII